MRRSIWFKATCVGRVPVHWTPVAWQGWAAVAVYVMALCLGLTLHRFPTPLVLFQCSLVVTLVSVAALTDDRGSRKPP